ncbi:uncharacterized protein LOC132628471 [Lycium barbarum]|uniref:uncharacterized protein LOC132628471 n=1 Tax=Lycium barbarum TaxID=112863 RepID=UPI00293F71DF|nr:uncharacterized protein LOC132628471 [Lycium barbarum]
MASNVHENEVFKDFPDWEDYVRALRKSIVQSFLDQFDALLNKADLIEEQSMSCLLAGLKPDIAVREKFLGARTLMKAYGQAKLIDKELNLLETNNTNLIANFLSNKSNYPRNNYYPKKNYPPILPNPNSATSQPYKSNTTKIFPAKPFSKPTRILSSTEMDERRSKGLCYWCEEKYVPGHNCRKGKQLYLFEVEEGDDHNEEVYHEVEEELRIEEEGRSTYNFIDYEAAKRLGCPLKTVPAIPIAIANGSKVMSSYISGGFSWKMQSVEFSSDMLILALGGYDVVLIIQCNLKWNSWWENQKVSLIGSQPTETQLVDNKQIKKLMQKPAQLAMMAITMVTIKHEKAHELNSQEVSIPRLVQHVIDRYSSIFEAPTSLPSHRVHDHKIVLKEGVSPVNVIPYRYPTIQKDEIEKQVQEMLDSGVIRPSVSPFSSPILMVKKEDDSWRMCIDYRELNKHTVKDKFPIPVIEELLDELGGAQFFTKLDLRSGYHQIRMLDHLEHLEVTFKILQHHSLFVKLSKCSFAQKKVEYLGHIISRGGVAADPKKVQGMQEWPSPRTIKALRGFLGLSWYYRRLIKGYGIVARPLTNLLKKDAFKWSPEAEKSFQQMKTILISPPVLALLDFTIEFLIDADACSVGVGAVMM